jgi:ABC-type sulfate/molybdate transport systems ATPase subunit
MYGLLTRVKQHTHVTTLHITHNREDADSLADCVLMLADGKVQRLDRREEPIARDLAKS